MAQVTAVPNGISDIAGTISFSTNIPYCVLDTGLQDSGNTGSILSGNHVGVTMNYNTVIYPPQTDGITAGYTGLAPDSANIMLYNVAEGITMANYMITTTNSLYPIVYSDNYQRWAFPSNLGSGNLPSNILKCVINPVSKFWYTFGSAGSSGSTGSNVNCSYSKDGIVWNLFNCPFMSNIVDLSFDQYGMGLAVGYGGVYNIAILSNDMLWFPLESSSWKNNSYSIGDILGIKRGSSWYVYGTFGIYESTNGYDWTLTFTTETIISLDFNDIGKIFAVSKTNFYEKISGTWQNITASKLDEGGTPLSDITSLVNFVSVTSIFSVFPSFVLLMEDSSLINYSFITSLWSYAGSNIQNVTVLSADFSTEGQKGIYIANVPDLNGNLILNLYTDPNVSNTAYPINVSTVGLTATSYSSAFTRDWTVLTYDTDTNAKGTFGSISGTTAGPTGHSVILPTIFGASGGISATGTTGYTSEPLSAFSFSFTTDIYSPKQFMFTGVSGDTYEFDIFEASKKPAFDFITNTYQLGGINNSVDTYSQILGIAGFSYFNASSLNLIRNMTNSKIYKNQLSRYGPVLSTINNIVTATGSTGGMTEYLKPSWYTQVLTDSDITKFYTAVQNFLKSGIGSYNTIPIQNLFNLVGFLPLAGITTFGDLLGNLNGSQYFNQYSTILKAIASAEYDLTTEKTFMENFVAFMMSQEKIPMLNTLYSGFYSNLSRKKKDVLTSLNSGTSALYNYNTLPKYTASTIFRFDYNGIFLSLYLDGTLIHQYPTYGDSLTINYNFNTFNSLFNQIQGVQSGQQFGIYITQWNSVQSNLDLAISEAFKTFESTATNLVTIGKYQDYGLLADSLQGYTGITGLNTDNYINYDDVVTMPDILDTDPNLYLYTLSKFVGDPLLKARLGNLMTSFSYPVPLQYSHYYNNNSRIFKALYNNTTRSLISTFTTPWVNPFPQKQIVDEQFFTVGAMTDIVANTNKLDYQAIFDRYVDIYKRVYTNTDFLQTYDSNFFVNPRFPNIVSKTMLTDWMYPDMEGTTGIIDIFQNKQLVVPLSNLGISSTVTSITSLFTALNGITGLDPSAQANKTSLYAAFYDEILQVAGITAIQSTILDQRNTPYGLAKDFVSKIQTLSYTSPSFFDTYFTSGCSGATGVYRDLVNPKTEYLEVMNTAAQCGGTELFSLTDYQSARSDYQNMSISYRPAETILSSISAILRDTFLQSIGVFLKEKFSVQPMNSTKYLTNEQTYQYSTFFVPCVTGTTGILTSMQSPSYTVITDSFVDVNAVYSLFVSTYSSQISSVLEDIITEITTSDIDAITTIVNQLKSGTYSGLSVIQTISTNLNNQANFYTNLRSEFQEWKYKYLRLKYLDDDYARYTKMSQNILSQTPVGISGSTSTYTISTGIPSNFIVNIPPFDSKYWTAFPISGVGLTGYSYPRYNPHWSYYVGDTVAFDSYGSTAFSLYTCSNTDRIASIKGIPPGSFGTPGTEGITGISGSSKFLLIPGSSGTTSDLTSLLLWSEYHTPFAIDLKSPITILSKYDRYTYEEMNYALTYANTSSVSLLSDDKTTELYDPRTIYYKGDRVLYKNSIFQFQGSEILYNGVGLGVPPGNSILDDQSWRLLSTSGTDPKVAPSCGGIWLLDPAFNQAGFTGKYGNYDIITTKNVFNPYVCPKAYDETENYSFGDKVVYQQKIFTYIANSTYTLPSGATGPVFGITPPSADTFVSELVWKCCPYLNMSDQSMKPILPYNQSLSYTYGEVVLYNNLPYRFIFNNQNIQDFNQQSAAYSIGDQVEYMGYIFVSKVNSNVAVPIVPSAGNSGKQYWTRVLGYTGPTAPNYNSVHDYCADFNIYKQDPLYVSYDNSTWRWSYNPYNMNYGSTAQQKYLSLTSISGVPPPMPFPIEPWKYLPTVSGSTAYSDSTIYSKGDQVKYGDYCFECVGSGYSSAVVNEVGDELAIDLYQPYNLLLTGGIDLNDQNGRFLEQVITPGNDKQNYDIELGSETYGIPKWGNGLKDDKWANTGYISSMRKYIAGTFEITLNSFLYDYHICTGNYNTGNRGPTGPSMTLSLVPSSSGIVGNILTTNMTKLLNPSFKGITGIPSLTNLAGLTANTQLSTFISQADVTMSSYWGGILQKTYRTYVAMKNLNQQLNDIDKQWYGMLNYSSGRQLPLYAQLLESFYEEERYQPSYTGKPRNSRPLNLEPLPCFLSVSIVGGDLAGNMARFNNSLNKTSNGDLNQVLFGNYNPVTHSNIASFVKYYNGNGVGSTANNGGTPLMSNVMEYKDSHSFQLCDFSPVYMSLYTAYSEKLTSINIIDMQLSSSLGHDERLPVFYSGSISDLSDLRKGHNIASSQFDLLYSKGYAFYTGTDIPILNSYLTTSDLEILNLSVPLKSGGSMWFTDPDKGQFDKSGYYRRSGDKNLSEVAFVDSLPNVYQYQDFETIFKVMGEYTGPPSGFATACYNQYWIDQQISNSTPICEWDVNTKSWKSPYTTVLGLGFDRSTFQSQGYVMYHPIGGIKSNNLRNIWYAQQDDQAADNGRGWDSPSADRAFLGAGVPAGLVSARGPVDPMRYETPAPFLVSERDLLLSQGKRSPFKNDRCLGFLGYTLHIKKVSRVEPDYCTLETPQGLNFAYGADILRLIEVTKRRQESENTRSKTIQIVVQVIMSIVALVVIVVGAAATFGVAVPFLLGAFAAAFTVATIALSIAAAAVPDPAMKELLNNMMSNPAYMLANMTPSPANMAIRCQLMASNLQSHSDDVKSPSVALVKNRPSYSSPNYSQYMWARAMVEYIDQNATDYISKFNPYLISRIDLGRDEYNKALGFSDSQIFQTYMAGLSGTSGITGWDGYSNFISGMTGYSTGDLTSIMTIYGTNLQTISDYEASLKYPTFITDTPEYRPATIQISGIYYMDTLGTGVDLIPPNGFMPGGRTSTLGAYAKFTVIDPGDALFIYGNGGVAEGIEKIFNRNWQVITNPDSVGVTHTITFKLPVAITTGYCTIYSQFGVESFVASEPGADLGNIPFSYEGLPGNIGDLKNVTFNLTSQILGTESGPAGVGGGVKQWPVPQSYNAVRGSQVVRIGNTAKLPPSQPGAVPPQASVVAQSTTVGPVAGQPLKVVDRGLRMLDESVDVVEVTITKLKAAPLPVGKPPPVIAPGPPPPPPPPPVVSPPPPPPPPIGPPPKPIPVPRPFPAIKVIGGLLAVAAGVYQIVQTVQAIEEVLKQPTNPQTC